MLAWPSCTVWKLHKSARPLGEPSLHKIRVFFLDKVPYKEFPSGQDSGLHTVGGKHRELVMTKPPCAQLRWRLPWGTCPAGQGVGLQSEDEYHWACSCQRRKKGAPRFQEEAPCGTRTCEWRAGLQSITDESPFQTGPGTPKQMRLSL